MASLMQVWLLVHAQRQRWDQWDRGKRADRFRREQGRAATWMRRGGLFEGVFGPHSPRECPQDGPPDMGLVGTGLEEPNNAHAGRGEKPIDHLSQFLISCTSPLRAALLPTPVDGGGKDGGATGKLGRRNSGRLAAKPTAGWSTMDKVQLVLMKKGGVWAGDSPMVAATAADLQKYRDIYKQPLLDNFVAAITEMVDATGGPDKKTGQQGLGQAQVAVA